MYYRGYRGINFAVLSVNETDIVVHCSESIREMIAPEVTPLMVHRLYLNS